MKYKLLILSLVVSLCASAQPSAYTILTVRNDSIFQVRVVDIGDSVYMYIRNMDDIVIVGIDSAKINIRNQWDTARMNLWGAILNRPTLNRVGDSLAAHWEAIVGKQPIGNYLTATGNGSQLTNMTASQVGLGNVTNESKATILTSPAITGTPTGITKTHVGLGNVDNTADASKPVSTAQAAAIALKSSIHVGIDAGANDSYVITASPAPSSYTVGMVVILKANTANTGAASVNVNGLGVKTIVKRVSTALANGDIPALSFKMLVYDGTNFVIINPVVN